MQRINPELTPTTCVSMLLQDTLFLAFKVREEKPLVAAPLLHLLLPPFVTVCFHCCSPEAQQLLRVDLCSLSTAGRQDKTLGDLLIISLSAEKCWRSLHLYVAADWPFASLYVVSLSFVPASLATLASLSLSQCAFHDVRQVFQQVIPPQDVCLLCACV